MFPPQASLSLSVPSSCVVPSVTPITTRLSPFQALKLCATCPLQNGSCWGVIFTPKTAPPGLWDSVPQMGPKTSAVGRGGLVPRIQQQKHLLGRFLAQKVRGSGSQFGNTGWHFYRESQCKKLKKAGARNWQILEQKSTSPGGRSEKVSGFEVKKFGGATGLLGSANRHPILPN